MDLKPPCLVRMPVLPLPLQRSLRRPLAALYVATKRVSTLAALFNAQGQTRLYDFFSRPFGQPPPRPPPSPLDGVRSRDHPRGSGVQPGVQLGPKPPAFSQPRDHQPPPFIDPNESTQARWGLASSGWSNEQLCRDLGSKFSRGLGPPWVRDQAAAFKTRQGLSSVLEVGVNTAWTYVFRARLF